MFNWLNGPGASLRSHIPGSTNYLTDLRDRGESSPGDNPAEEQGRPARQRPFPLNSNYVSESILSAELRGEVYRRVVEQGKGVREVSVELGIDMRRVGAVVRLVELEKRWASQVCSFFILSFLFVDLYGVCFFYDE